MAYLVSLTVRATFDLDQLYRAIYRVLEKDKKVEVLHIRYGARRRFKKLDTE